MAIAVDAMGGDVSPRNPVLGAVKAARDRKIDVLLVGDETAIRNELSRCDEDTDRIEIVPAAQAISMDESVAAALRTKRQSSLRICFDLHRQGAAEGVVSAGNSGAVLAIGRHVLKMLPGINRPCISAMLPSLGGKVLLIDAGANTDCTPRQLLQFAVLGHLYLSEFHGVSAPRIGLLNVGTEEGKGDDRRRRTYDQLKASPLCFVGNIEGESIFNGDIDIILTDGFAGNILLKSVQAAAGYLMMVLKQEIDRPVLPNTETSFLSAILDRIGRRTDYAEFGGAPLLGIRGNAIVCHGKSNPEAISFGIGLAQWAAREGLAERLQQKIASYSELLA
jgi:phosphate acyltransferase